MNETTRYVGSNSFGQLVIDCSWSTINAFCDLSSIFAIATGHRSPSGSRNKVFLLSLIYAWGLPVVITGLTLIIDHSGAMDVSYGKTRCQQEELSKELIESGLIYRQYFLLDR